MLIHFCEESLKELNLYILLESRIGLFFKLYLQSDMALTKTYHCPRCNNTKLIVYDDSFDCPICMLEFEKKDFDIFEDDEILAVEEKIKVVRALMDDD